MPPPLPEFVPTTRLSLIVTLRTLSSYPKPHTLNPIPLGLAGEVLRGQKMLYSGTDPESYITEYNLVYQEKSCVHTDTAAKRPPPWRVRRIIDVFLPDPVAS